MIRSCAVQMDAPRSCRNRRWTLSARAAHQIKKRGTSSSAPPNAMGWRTSKRPLRTVRDGCNSSEQQQREVAPTWRSWQVSTRQPAMAEPSSKLPNTKTLATKPLGTSCCGNATWSRNASRKQRATVSQWTRCSTDTLGQSL